MATEEPVITQGFQDVTRTTAPEFYIRFLDDVETNEDVQAYRGQMQPLLNAQEGEHILDVGCGVGHQVRRLAQLVGGTGRVVGVDISETLIAEARSRATGLNLPVEYQVGKAYPLDFPDQTFNGCWSERVFMYLEDPQKALAEMIRVVRPGGRIVVQDLDIDSCIIDAPDRAVTRRLVHSFGDSMPNGRMGRQLPAIFKESGLADITVVPHLYRMPYDFHQMVFGGIVEKAQEAGLVSEAEATNWWNDLERANNAGHFLFAAPGFIVCGRRP